MSELRWDPVQAEWVVVAPHRTKRPISQGASACPFCASSGNPEVQGDWELLALPNKYGSLGEAGGGGTGVAPPADVNRVTPAGGVTEVILYSREHEGGLHTLDADRLARLFDLWAEREAALGAREDVRYVLAFENRGAAVGVSQRHPHGQIYALPFVPPRVTRMLETAGAFMRDHGGCLHCTLVSAERKAGERLIAENEHAAAFVPYAARLPYEVRVYPKRHVQRIRDLTPAERRGMGVLVGGVLRAYVRRFRDVDDPPFILAHYPAPSEGAEHPAHHYHVAFYPFQRTDAALKHLGGAEFAGGAFVNDASPEERARELREAAAEAGLPS